MAVEDAKQQILALQNDLDAAREAISAHERELKRHQLQAAELKKTIQRELRSSNSLTALEDGLSALTKKKPLSESQSPAPEPIRDVSPIRAQSQPTTPYRPTVTNMNGDDVG